MIRTAGPADAAGIAGVHIASWRTTYPGIVAQEHIDQLSLDTFISRWERRLGDAAQHEPLVVVAVDDSENVIGFASGGAAREEGTGYDAELYAIYLLEDAQTRGLGRKLIARVAAELHTRGHRNLYVRVLSENPAARFYQHLGGHPFRVGLLPIGTQQYPETWYGWDDITALIAPSE